MNRKPKQQDDNCPAFIPDTVSRCKHCKGVFIEKKLSCKCGANARIISAVKP